MSFLDVMLRDAFQKLHLDPSEVKVFKGSFIGLSGKRVQVWGHVTLESTCVEGEDAKMIEVSYLVVIVVSPYNVILGLPAINAIGEVIST